METVGRLTGASRSFESNNILLTFEVESSVVNQIDELGQDKLRIKAVKYRQKRSLDANAYCWVLCTKIAEAVKSSKEEVYEEMLQKYGYVYEDDTGYITITVKCSIDMSKIDGHWKYIKDNGKFASYLMIKGSSEYDTKEMSHFIDCIVQEAKELGIETRPEQEIERMLSSWQKA